MPEGTPESGGSTPHVERVNLLVDAPLAPLQGENNGLAYAINRLRTINDLLRQAQGNYDRLLSKGRELGSVPVPTAKPGRTPVETAATSSAATSAAPTIEAERVVLINKKAGLETSRQVEVAPGEVETRPKGEGDIRSQIVGRKALKNAINEQMRESEKLLAADLKLAGSDPAKRLDAWANYYKFRSNQIKGLTESESHKNKITAEQESKNLEVAAGQMRRYDEKIIAANKVRKADEESQAAAAAAEKARLEQARAEKGSTVFAGRDKQEADAKAKADDFNREQRRQQKILDDAKAKEKARLEQAARTDAASAYSRHQSDELEAHAKRKEAIYSPAGMKGKTPGQLSIEELNSQAAMHKANQLKAQSLALEADARYKAGDKAARPQADNFKAEAARNLNLYSNATAAAAQQTLRLDAATYKVGKNLLDNTRHVATWAASVGILYGSLALARQGMTSMVNTGYQMARLEQVFRGSRTESRGLADDVMRMASINGRAVNESMEATISWTRLGLGRVATNTAVRTSMMAANVAEMTVAESTDRLSTIMQAYKLSVGELPGLLGQINSISNTYNVTNRAMFDGVARVAGIAAQAKIPLVELMAIIGAGVGGSGGTGPNFGNAIKSIIGSLASSNVRDILRKDYKFEVTAEGGDELKNMSALFSELYVKYMALGEAEQQTMLFSVAGKNQASRMASILDNYIRSQVLAIQAQLNLNSAEEENAKIKATMKAQLTALASEWERFVAIQSRTGQDVGLSNMLMQVTKAFTNLLRFANTPVGAGAVGLIGGSLIALVARLGVTAMAMESVNVKGGILRNTGQAIRNAMGDLHGALIRTAGGWGTLAQSMAGAKLNAPKGFIGPLPDAKAPVPGTVTSLNAVPALAIGAVKAAAHLGIVLGIIYALSKAWNEFSDAAGLSNDKLTDKLDKLAQAAERADKAAQAAAMSIRLIGVAQEVLNSNADFGKKSKLLATVAEIAYPKESGQSQAEQSANEAKTKALNEQWQLMLKANEMGQIGVDLARISAGWVAREAQDRKRQMEELAKSEANVARRIAEYENPKGLMRLKSNVSRGEEIKKLRDEQSGYRAKMTAVLVDELKSNEEALQRLIDKDLIYQSLLERHKTTVESIGQLYQQMGEGGNRSDKLTLEIQGLQIAIGYWQKVIDDQKAYFKGVSEAGGTTRNKFTEDIKPISDEILKRREEAQKLLDAIYARTKSNYALTEQAAPDLSTGDTENVRAKLRDDNLRLREAEKTKLLEIEAVLIRIDELQGKKKGIELKGEEFDKTPAGEDQIHRQNLQKQADEALLKLKPKLAGKEDPTVKLMTEMADAQNLIAGFAATQANAFAQGDTEAEKLVNQYEKLNEKIAKTKEELNAVRGVPGKEQRFDNQTIELMTSERKQAEALIKLHERLLTLAEERTESTRKANREFEKGLLGAGPAELLRKLATSQVDPKNLTAGRIFSMAPDARKDLFERTDFFKQRDFADEERAGRKTFKKVFGTERPTEEQIQDEITRRTRNLPKPRDFTQPNTGVRADVAPQPRSTPDRIPIEIQGPARAGFERQEEIRRWEKHIAGLNRVMEEASRGGETTKAVFFKDQMEGAIKKLEELRSIQSIPAGKSSLPTGGISASNVDGLVGFNSEAKKSTDSMSGLNEIVIQLSTSMTLLNERLNSKLARDESFGYPVVPQNPHQ